MSDFPPVVSSVVEPSPPSFTLIHLRASKIKSILFPTFLNVKSKTSVKNSPQLLGIPVISLNFFQFSLVSTWSKANPIAIGAATVNNLVKAVIPPALPKNDIIPIKESKAPINPPRFFPSSTDVPTFQKFLKLSEIFFNKSGILLPLSNTSGLSSNLVSFLRFNFSLRIFLISSQHSSEGSFSGKPNLSIFPFIYKTLSAIASKVRAIAYSISESSSIVLSNFSDFPVIREDIFSSNFDTSSKDFDILSKPSCTPSIISEVFFLWSDNRLLKETVICLSFFFIEEMTLSILFDIDEKVFFISSKTSSRLIEGNNSCSFAGVSFSSSNISGNCLDSFSSDGLTLLSILLCLRIFFFPFNYHVNIHVSLPRNKIFKIGQIPTINLFKHKIHLIVFPKRCVT